MRLLRILFISSLFFSTSIFAEEYSKSQLIGNWSGQMGDYESSISFDESGTYTSTIVIMRRKMPATGKWSIKDGSIMLTKDGSNKAKARKITKLTKDSLETSHSDANGSEVKSTYVRK